MDEVKQDLRVRHTKQLLKEALLRLLQTKTIDKVTVTELCKTAHINRNTFYSHYRTPMDLLVEVEESFAEKIMNQSRGPLQDKNYAEMLRRVCHSIFEDRDLALVIISKNSSNEFINRVISGFYPLMIDLWSETNSTQEKYDTMYRYGVGGSYALLRHWVESGFKETPDKMANNLLQLNLSLLHGYLGDPVPPEDK